MSEPHEPDAATLARLWRSAQPHALRPEQIGEYAAIRQGQGEEAARSVLPGVAEHLATGCQTCADDLHEIEAILAAERVRELATRAGRIVQGVGGRWLATFARGLRFASQPIGQGPGDTVEGAPADAEPPPWVPQDGPAVMTLELDVEGEQQLVVEVSPYGDGCSIRLRQANRDREGVHELAEWEVRFEGTDRLQPAVVRTNRSGAAVLADVTFDELLSGQLTLRPPDRSS